MYLKNVLSACLALWFAVSPWVFDFRHETNAMLICLVLGSLQFVCSMLALGKSGKQVWQNWVCVCFGALFIAVPNVFELQLKAFFSFVVLGFLTMLLNYANLYPESESQSEQS
ncbi:SPW repeat protein [Paenibacillus oryzisoli]|uniref:SPW repeat protein n=1 Tax=Paenibacillus oryzisoli TaxID=1850517 RepID=UPI003D2B3110